MAYTDNEYRVQVRGNVGDSEMWNNTWSFLDLDGAQDPADLGPLLNAFYGDIGGFASWLSNDWVTVGATAKNLMTNALIELPWANQTGSSEGELLPTQLAMRVSLSGAAGARGGPFLTGFVVAAVDGSLIDADCVSDFIGALEQFTASLTANDWQLRIDRPTTNVTAAVLAGRVGERFDVIRKRANDTAESYSTFTVA